MYVCIYTHIYCEEHCERYICVIFVIKGLFNDKTYMISELLEFIILS